MEPTEIERRPASIPPELLAWVIWLRAGVIVALLALLLAGRALAHLPIPMAPIIALALGALAYNGVLGVAAQRARQAASPEGDRRRAHIIYAGGVLDAVALALVVSLTGRLISPWLYFFLATSIVSSAILPPTPGRVLTALNALAALVVVVLPISATAVWPAAFWSEPGYAAVVGISLIGLMGLTAYAVSVPAERARSAARFQEGLAHMASFLQRATDLQEAVRAVAGYAHQWFRVDAVVVLLLEGEELSVRAVAGDDTECLRGRHISVSQPQSLEVDVLRRRGGFFVNDLRHSPYAAYPLAAELGAEAILLVPLAGSLGVVGVLTMVDRHRTRRFTNTLLEQAALLGTQAAAAVENARLLARVREESDSVMALLDASERLTRSQDLPTLLTDLNRIAAEATGCERSSTFLWDAQREVFCFGSAFGHPQPAADAIRTMEFPRGAFPLVERVLAGETFVLSSEQAGALLSPELQRALQPGVSAVVALKTEHAVQGVMTVSYTEPEKDFSAEQLWLLRGLARHAALAIERERLIDRDHEATATAEALVALGRELSATLDRPAVLARIPEMAATAAACDFGVLSVWDRETHTLRFLSAHGFSPEATQTLLESSIEVAPTPAPAGFIEDGYLEIDHPQSLPNLPAALMSQWGVSSLLAAYMSPVDKHIGSLTVGYRTRTGPFSDAQIRLLTGLAQQAAVVLENTHLVEDLRQANRLKSDFLSTVSHELRTPLNAIIGYTDLFREGALGRLQPEQLEVMDVIFKKGQQLLELINMTLDVTRLEAGQGRVVISEFALEDLLAEIRQELADEVPASVTFRCEASAGLPLLRSDRPKLKTVIKNLAHNALKFTRQGCVDVHAAPAPTASHVQIAVHDTGIGIAAADRKTIFEMFRQLEPAMTRRFGGVGLGLYIVQRLLELLRGDIGVESEPGKGSVFTVTVPERLA